MKKTPETTKKESLRLADRRLPLSSDIEENRDLMYSLLKTKGYTVEELHPVWAVVAKNSDARGTTVQLEIDPDGSNLDIVLLSDTTDEIGGGFPLGGSWACKSTVKLTAGNIIFGVERIESFFGVVHEDRDHMASNWDNVQKNLKFESFMRTRKETSC